MRLSNATASRIAQATASNIAATMVDHFEANEGGQQLFMESKKTQQYFVGGNHSGKTFCNIMKAAWELLPEKDINGKADEGSPAD